MRLVWSLLALVASTGVAGADERAESVLKALIERGTDAVAFSDAFRQQVEPAQVDPLISAMKRQIGPVESVEAEDDRFILRSDGWEVRGRIVLNGEGAISGLFIEPAVRTGQDLETASAALNDLGAEVSWLVTREGETLAAQGAETPMPVASAFKLGVLATLSDRIDAGDLAWDDVTPLSETHVSLPSGAMRDWPVGTPVTLGVAAILMMSQSDNTATDLLIDAVGRDRVADKLGADFLPTTREVFALAVDPEVGAAYLDAPPADRAAIAERAAQDLPAAEAVVDAAPYAWPVPLATLCALAAEVRDLPAMSVDPGPVPTDDWSGIAYKGGSLDGILNYTAALTDSDGRLSCVALTVAGRTATEAEAATAFRGLLAALKETP